jgi:hypothetical protein
MVGIDLAGSALDRLTGLDQTIALRFVPLPYVLPATLSRPSLLFWANVSVASFNLKTAVARRFVA